ncbi:S-adenosyl-L-methionine-dependent methyltransferase [Jimgerdemannia flammicorona]|uniref:S-adenosyl-L-methionine-dependent methyltransferase n=1 Tax=Jimgerdemannia flammicorona TaxID=994334 RepID=A0A433QSQ4_9FUNG|nr:S-adenosyl-L-methionine-dependent methyltransferase [Jimgerdemannia flammicorona]
MAKVVQERRPIRALEFFSGIGGLHYGFHLSGVLGEVVSSFDVNTVGNEVYRHNFNKDPNNTSIDTLSAKDIDRYQANCWLMSPPCQPYTRGGKMLDDQDPRAKALLHLIDILPKLSQPPEYIFLENVLNFETSRSRIILLTQLDSLSYTVHECLLSPLQFGIANDRLRYYLMARRRSAGPSADPTTKYSERAIVHTRWPFEGEEVSYEPVELARVLEQGVDEKEEFRVPEKDLLKSFDFRYRETNRPSDIGFHQGGSKQISAYGSRHFYKAGSILQTKQIDVTSYDFTNPSTLIPLGLRFFTPLEVARLHAFPVPPFGAQPDPPSEPEQPAEPRSFRQPTSPPYLEFPPTVTTIQRHRLLGNSLNCWVVGELLRCVLFKMKSEEVNEW